LSKTTTSASCGDEPLELLDLARADVGGDVDLVPPLEQAAHHVQAGRLGQPPELLQGIILRRLVRPQGEDHPDQDGLLVAPRTLVAIEFNQGGFGPRFPGGWVGPEQTGRLS
jgi:hypothetical protein